MRTKEMCKSVMPLPCDYLTCPQRLAGNICKPWAGVLSIEFAEFPVQALLWLVMCWYEIQKIKHFPSNNKLLSNGWKHFKCWFFEEAVENRFRIDPLMELAIFKAFLSVNEVPVLFLLVSNKFFISLLEAKTDTQLLIVCRLLWK